MDEEIRSYKGPPSLAITEHWNYEDRGKDFFGGYCYMSQGPLPALWGGTQSVSRGLWGEALVNEMQRYNHSVGLKVVAEYMPQEQNRVTLADEADQYRVADRAGELLLVRQRQADEQSCAALYAASARSGGRARNMGPGRRYLPPQRHGPDGGQRAPASSTPTAGRGTFPTSGSATVPCSRRSAVSILR